MVTAVNYETSVLNTNGEKAMFGGSIRRDVGILLFGDSNMCGAGGDVDPALDATTQQIYYLSGADIVAVNTAATPYIEHSLNDFIDEVGPDLPFCHRYAVERQTSRERIVALGAGDGGSGLSTGQLAVGGDTRTLSKTMVDTLLAQNPFNEIGAIMLLFGANDVGDFTPTTLWRDGFEAIIDAYRGSEFVPNALQKEFIRVPIIVAGMAERFVGNASSRLAIQNHIIDVPNRKPYTGYANVDGLTSQAGDVIHMSGVGNRILGYERAWTALIEAEANT